MALSSHDKEMRNCLEPTCVEAPAKLNLGLRIVGRDRQGFHLLESLFWPIDLVDTLTIAPSEKHGIDMVWRGTGSAPLLPAPKNNLVLRALTAFPSKSYWQVGIQKRIPLGGGLGGGSANAGTVLKFLNERSQALGKKNLSELALSLGADVPFFLQPTPSWVTGVGEKILPLPVDKTVFAEMTFLLLLLPQSTPTKDVFDHYKKSGVPFSTSRKAPGELHWKSLSDLLSTVRNDLETPAVSVTPLVGEALRAMRQHPAIYTGLSGSGSTCFSIFRSGSEANAVAKDLSDFCRKNSCRSLLAKSFLVR